MLRSITTHKRRWRRGCLDAIASTKVGTVCAATCSATTILRYCCVTRHCKVGSQQSFPRRIHDERRDRSFLYLKRTAGRKRIVETTLCMYCTYTLFRLALGKIPELLKLDTNMHNTLYIFLIEILVDPELFISIWEKEYI